MASPRGEPSVDPWLDSQLFVEISTPSISSNDLSIQSEKSLSPPRSPSSSTPLLLDNDAPSSASLPLFDAGLLVDDLGCGPVQSTVHLICSGFQFAYAYVMAAFSYLIPALGESWHISNLSMSMIYVTVFVGQCIGGPIVGLFADRNGRKSAMILVMVTLVIFSFALAFSLRYPVLIVTSFIVGFSGAGAGLGYPTVSELVPTNLRGPLIILLDTGWGLGSAIASVLAFVSFSYTPLFGFGESWNWFVGFSAFIPLFFSIFVFFIPESFRFLILHGRTTEAKRILNGIDQCRCCNSGGNRVLPKNGQFRLKRPSIDQDSDGSGSICHQLCHWRVLWPLLSSAALWALSLSIYYGCMMVAPNIFSSEWARYVGPGVSSLIEIPATIITALLSRAVGHRITAASAFLLSGIGAFVMLIPATVMQTQTVRIIMTSVVRGFGDGACCATIAMTTESIPTSTRGIGIGFSASCGLLASILIPFLGQMYPENNHALAIILLGAAGVLGCVLTLLHPVEGVGKRLTDVASEQDVESSWIGQCWMKCCH